MYSIHVYSSCLQLLQHRKFNAESDGLEPGVVMSPIEEQYVLNEYGVLLGTLTVYQITTFSSYWFHSFHFIYHSSYFFCFILFFCGQVGSSKQSLWSPEIKNLSLDSVYDNVLLRRITLFPFHLFHIIFFLFQMVMVPFFLIFYEIFFNFFFERFFACFIISHSWHGLLH